MANSRCQVAKGILKPDPFWIWQYQFTYSFPTECDWIHEGNGSRRDQPILWPLAFVTSKPAFVRSRSIWAHQFFAVYLRGNSSSTGVFPDSGRFRNPYWVISVDGLPHGSQCYKLLERRSQAWTRQGLRRPMPCAT